MAGFSSTVRVTFIDDATGEAFAETEMPPADLPESFELDTTLHLGDEDWSVVGAEPKTRAEFAKSKTLTLRLRRVELLDPNEILYSLPSICDAIPGLNDQPLEGNEFVLADDDWRQFELVSRDFADVVDAEIEGIRAIHENASAEVGWREIHVRSRLEAPIARSVALSELSGALNVAETPAGVAYRGATTQIANGYALRAGNLTAYGVTLDGDVQVIGLDQYAEDAPSRELIMRLATFARGLELDLVYWCRCVRVGPDDPLFASLLANEV